jgi:hypothetical protein
MHPRWKNPWADNASPRCGGAALISPVNQRYLAALARKMIGSAAAKDARAYYDDFHLMLAPLNCKTPSSTGSRSSSLRSCQ